MEPVELDADSLDRVLQLVSDSTLLRAVHTSRLLDKSWEAAVNVRAQRLREVTAVSDPCNLARLLAKLPNLLTLDAAYSSITPEVCEQLHTMQLKELTLAQCASLEPQHFLFLHQLTQLEYLKLSKIRAAASTILEQCNNLRRLRHVELHGFTSLNEKLFTNLLPLTALRSLSLTADEDSNATLRSLSMQLLAWCTPHLTSFECGKIESTYPLAALRGLEELQKLSLTNCKLFLKPDITGHDLLVEIAHLTQLTSVSLRQLATRPSDYSQMKQDIRQLKHLKSLTVEQGKARGMLEGLTALTNLAELVLLDELTHIQSRFVLSEMLLSLYQLTHLDIQVSGDVLVEGFRLFRNLPYLRQLNFQGVKCNDSKGVVHLFWGLTSLVAPVTRLRLRDADFSGAHFGRYHTAAGANVAELDLGRFPLHSLASFSKVFPDVISLRLIVHTFMDMPLQSWAQLQKLCVEWQPVESTVDVDPLDMCVSLVALPRLKQLTIECPAGQAGDKQFFAQIADRHQDMLQALPGVDVVVCLQGDTVAVLTS